VLPFYALFLVWYRISDGLINRFERYDMILFQKMYAYPQIMYVESTQEEKEALLLYMKDWFVYRFSNDDENYNYTHFYTLNDKRFTCMRGRYANAECAQEPYVYENYSYHYTIPYIPGEKDNKKWL
jgi:hypothetical protein